MISARNLVLRAGSRVLLEDLSFEVRQGEFVAVIGPNGVGKTTMLRTLCGMRTAEGGEVRIFSRDVTSLTSRERARLLAHIASDDLFTDYLSVRDVVAMGRYAHHHWWQWNESARDGEIIESALRAVGMEEFGQRRFETLSSGERQRIWLALALAQEAPVLLLDEPTSHLDIRVAHQILALLRAQVRAGKTVVSVLHDVNEAAEFADRILLIGCGTMLAFDTPQSVLASSLFERAYGIDLELVRTASGALRAFPKTYCEGS